MALLLKFPPGSESIAPCWVAILDNTLKYQSSSIPLYMPESFKSLECQQHSFFLNISIIVRKGVTCIPKELQERLLCLSS